MDGMEITQFTYFQQVQLTKSVHFFMTPAQITLGLDHTAVQCHILDVAEECKLEQFTTRQILF